MAKEGFTDPRIVPHESERERYARERLTKLLVETPIPPEYLIDNLPVYLRQFQLADLLSMDALYRMLPEIPGVIMEFGVLHGRHLATFTALRSIYEPYNSLRRVIGFDTFSGFPDIAAVDKATASAVPGRFAVPEGEVEHLREVLAAHEAAEPFGHTQRSFVVQGDVRETVPRYLEENPETVIALAYFDLDLYQPTKELLTAIRPHLTKGSILAFDELAHPKWPGETTALREVFGLDHAPLRQLPGREPPVIYMKWGE
ncbi:class I SAM-dependent methyltransferase [Streptomyces chitinivorans]|uniref:Class I SAM-dependent methyltransferase n=1 Tax=Streptomyces chitinivorans TaxID=1257027 RepID=A0ABW7HYI6_9ACTN|nr:class I SAM-dependent methyltransferase [Streptomyces chitinivorans]MDH2409214.1 TylF/MycF/NovP-related O-methyltransferase [Streptomyces chitinivorans]